MCRELALKMAIAFWCVCACPIWTLADDEHSVQSPNAFQLICDQAMPALLQGKPPRRLARLRRSNSWRTSPASSTDNLNHSEPTLANRSVHPTSA